MSANLTAIAVRLLSSNVIDITFTPLVLTGLIDENNYYNYFDSEMFDLMVNMFNLIYN